MPQHGFELPTPPGFEDEGLTRRNRRDLMNVGMSKLFAAFAVAAFVTLLFYFYEPLANVFGNRMNQMRMARVAASVQRFRGHMLRRQFDDARVESDKVIQLEPGLGHYMRAQTWRMTAKFDNALDDYTESIEAAKKGEPFLVPLDIMYAERGDVLGLVGRIEDALDDYNRALEINPTNPRTLNNRAYNLALARRDLDTALEDVQQALSIEGDNAAYLDTRGYVLYLLGRHQEALKDFDRILNHLDDFSSEETQGVVLGEIHFHRGLVYRALEDPKRAESDFAVAQRLGFKATDMPEPVAKMDSSGDGRAKVDAL